MKFSNRLVLDLFLDDRIFVSSTMTLLANVFETKPRLENRQIIKDLWIDEVQ